jgi:hypothetical protein
VIVIWSPPDTKHNETFPSWRGVPSLYEGFDRNSQISGNCESHGGIFAIDEEGEPFPDTDTGRCMAMHVATSSGGW